MWFFVQFQIENPHLHSPNTLQYMGELCAFVCAGPIGHPKCSLTKYVAISGGLCAFSHKSNWIPQMHI